MPLLDVRSITLVLCVISALQAVGLAVFFLATPRYPGVMLWVWSAVANVAGFILLVLRDLIPDLFSVIVANGILLLANLLLHRGLLRFIGHDRPLQRYLTTALVLATLLGLLPFTFVLPDTSARTLLISVCVAIINALNCWNLLQVAAPDLRRALRYTATVYGLYSLWMFVRALLAALETPLQGVFQPTIVQALHFVVITLVSIFSPLGLMALSLQRRRSEQRQAGASEPVLSPEA